MMLTVRMEEWPEGLRCLACDRSLESGDLYSERLYGFVDEVPAVEIICTDCALPIRE